MPDQPLILRRGDTVKPVGNCQEQLNAVGQYGLEVDNVFGPATEAAVRDFQSRAGLPPTGVVDPATWRRLFNGFPLPLEAAPAKEASPLLTAMQAGYSAEINVAIRTLTLFQNGGVVASYPVAVGKPATPTPTGTFPILNKAFEPGGAFGTRWLGLTEDGIGVHGTNVPSSVGLAVSNGCIRMYNQDVEAIWELLFVGDPVTIIPGEGSTGGTYTVQPGDTLFGIAQRFGTTVEAIMAANNLTSDIIYVGQVLTIPGAPQPPPPPPPPGTPPPRPDTNTYTVQPGDTLFLIARRFNTSLGVLRELNNLSGDVIYAGQVLLVPAQPPQQTHVVQPGETLFGIAQRYGTTVAELQRLNNLTTDIIYPGQVLQVA